LISLAILACALFAARQNAYAAGIPVITSDLRADAAVAVRAHQPLLLFFSLADCPYCAGVRSQYLGPMTQDAGQTRRALIRELPIEATLTDFDGARKPAQEIAARYKVTVFPTIVMVNAQGAQIADPLVGFSSPDFYGGLLDGRIDAANQKLQPH
jgi:thioredoxin-related protein